MATPDLRRVSEILDAVIDQPRERRRAVVSERCAEDTRLCEHILTLLDEIESDEFLSMPVVSLGEESGAAAAPMLHRIGPYELIRLIGEGGMGAVYEARQENPNRLVAVKVLRAGLLSKEGVRRFTREAQVLGVLHHPGIAQVYEAGTARTPLGEVPYFAMELIRGVSLSAYVQGHTPSVRAKLELVAQVADAVEHAHRQGVIHRDLKPANILIEVAESRVGPVASVGSDDARSSEPVMVRAKILDFGVARAAQNERSDTANSVVLATLQTDAGQIIGTLSYMSPEQVSGDSLRVDARSDVYSLGVIAYEMLAGRLPIDIRGKALPDATHRILHDEPTRLRSIDSRLSGDIDTIIAKAIEKESTRRYQSAAELASDIRRYLRDEPIVARPATSLYQLRKFARRNRGLVAGVLATFLTLVVGAATTTYWALRASERRVLAEQSADKLQRKAYFASIAAAHAAIERGDAVSARNYLDSAPEPLRGWEWNYVHQRTDRSERTVKLGPLRLPCVALDGDFAFGQSDTHGVFMNWVDQTAIECEPCFSISSIYALGVSPTRDRFAVCGEWGSALWDAQTGKLLKVFPSEARFEARPFTFDGTQLLLSRVNPKHVLIADARTGEIQHEIPFEGLVRTFVSASPTGPYAVVEIRDGVTGLIELPSGKVVWDHAGVQPRFSPDGRLIMLYTGVQDLIPSVHLIDALSGAARGSMLLPELSISVGGAASNTLALSPDGRMLAMLTPSGAIRLIEAATFAPLGVLGGLDRRGGGFYHGVSFSSDGQRLAAQSSGNSFKVWNLLPSVDWSPAMTRENNSYDTGAIAPNENFSVTADWGRVAAWDVATSGPKWVVFPSYEFFTTIGVSPDSARVCVAGDRGTMYVLDAASGATLHSGTPHGAVEFGSNWSSSVSVGDSGIWAGYADGAIVRVDPGSLAPLQTERVGSGTVASVAVAPNEQIVACLVRGDPTQVVLLHAKSIARISSVPMEGATAIGWSGDSKMLAVGHTQGVVVLDSSGGEMRRIDAAASTRTTVMFSPDGSRLGSVSKDGLVSLWFADSGDSAFDLPLPRRERALTSCFRSDGSGLLVVTVHSAAVTFDASSLSPEVARRRDLVRRGRDLFRRCKAEAEFVAEMVPCVESASSEPADVRTEAVRQARLLGEHAALLNNNAYIKTAFPPDAPTLQRAILENDAALARCTDPFGYMVRGKVLHRAKRFAEAIEALTRAAEELSRVRPTWGDGNAEYFALMGACEAGLGRADAAHEWFAKFDASKGVREPRDLVNVKQMQAVVDEAKGWLSKSAPP